ncbi:MAG: hypothetical protein Q9212_002440 [Teloschistes hypoglaucus]
MATMPDSKDDAFADEPATTALKKYIVPRTTSTCIRTKDQSANKGGDCSITELIELMNAWTGSRSISGVVSRNPFQIRARAKANIHNLPPEIGLMIFEFLEGSLETLKTARLVSKTFSDLASPVLFKSVAFEDDYIKDSEFRAFCAQPWIAKHTKSLKLRGDRIYGNLCYPEYLVELLRACDWSVLRSVSIYRPVWTEDERDHIPMWDLLFKLKADARIKFDYTEELRFGEKYTQEDIQYMVDRDIVPSSLTEYIRVKRGEFKALDEYVDRKEGYQERKKKILYPTLDLLCSEVARLLSIRLPLFSHTLSLAPAENPTHPPVDNLIQPPADNSTQPPASNPTQPPADKPIQPPADDPIQPPADSPTQPPADNPTQPSKKQSTLRWRASAPTYTPARPQKFSAPLLSSRIVPKYDPPSLHWSSPEPQAYKPKEPKSSLEPPSG